MSTVVDQRGARRRILDAANVLFYRDGINPTGVDKLAEEANVSKRTLYHHFASKDDVVVAYLERMGTEELTGIGRLLGRSDLAPRDTLLAIFDLDATERGCPFLLATAEFADAEHPARAVSCASKRAVVEELTRLAGEIGARDPSALGYQLAALYDGANVLAVALGSDEPLRHARPAAAALIDLATG